MTPRLGVMILRDVAPEDEVELARSLARLVEEIWIVEDLGYAGGVAQAAAILEATDEVVVGHGIAPAPFRNPAALAMEWAALARMYPGRLRGGLGHGLQTWMRQIGERVGSPLGLFEETMVVTRSLLDGETVSHHGRYVSLDGLALTFPPTVRPPLLAGVTGPQSLQLSGRIADGTILSEGFGPEKVAAARTEIDRGRSSAECTDHHDLTVFVGFYCGDLDALAPPPPGVPEAEWDVVGPSVDSVVPELQTLVDAGVDALTIIPYGDDPVAQLDLVHTEIWPRLRDPQEAV